MYIKAFDLIFFIHTFLCQGVPLVGTFEGDAWCPPSALLVLDVEGAGFSFEPSRCSGTCLPLRW